MDLNKKVGRTSLFNLCLVGLALIMGILFLFMYLGEFYFLEGAMVHAGSSGNNLIFREDPVVGLLFAWIFALMFVIILVTLIAVNFVKSFELPKYAIPVCLAFAGLLLLVSGILAFCTRSLIGGGSVGLAAIFAGIFGIVGFASTGLAAFFIYKD